MAPARLVRSGISSMESEASSVEPSGTHSGDFVTTEGETEQMSLEAAIKEAVK